MRLRLALATLAALVALCAAKRRADKVRTGMRDAETGLNLCDIQEAGVNMYCYCDSQRVRNATEATCWVYHGESAASASSASASAAGGLDDDRLAAYFASQRALRRLAFSVRPDARLKVVPSRALGELRMLSVLEIKYAALDALPSGAFANHSALAEVLLSRNQIASLGAGSFAHLPALTLLSLEENRLTEIPRGALVALPALRTLVLERNNISALADRALAALHGLEELELAGNQLAVLTADTFAGLRALKRLDLRANRLRVLPARAFAHSPRLEELILDENALQSVSAQAFDGLRELRRLRLADNQLTSLGADTLRAQPGLQLLDLRNNALRTLEFDTVGPLAENLRNASAHFFLEGNRFACDCRLAWMYALRNETPSAQVRGALDEVTCVLEPVDDVDIVGVDAAVAMPQPGVTMPGSQTLSDGEDLGYDEDDTDTDANSAWGTAGRAGVPAPGNGGGVRHLFEIALHRLPCPEQAEDELGDDSPQRNGPAQLGVASAAAANAAGFALFVVACAGVVHA